ncbi:ATP-grasp fold amidoligase family protein [Clostridium paraputrificum]|uniref:ATP-grasp fold amidoligase family protein n=1 Tax=Clostridium paraputrificum TaxID=29363 RepID=UPI0003FD9768|nr:ATP-grasp fold amidoligase family protein [Clostridium paraputrificum]
MNKKKLKNNKNILKLYTNYKKTMCILLTHFSPVIATKYVYKYNTGKKLDLRNPKTFNEKIQWLKLFGDQKLMIRCADKYEVRFYVEEKGCPNILNELYGVYNDVEDIDFEKLPQSFVLKTSDGCGTNIICHDKELLDVEKTKKQLSYWMTHKYGWETAEIHYLKIKPKIVCEKIIETVDGTLPNDFKFFCFNGEPKFFYYGYDRENGFKKLHCDLNWNIINITREKATLSPNDIIIPECFDEMIKYARILSEGIPFVRVDFYDSKGQAVFGEMTFTPTAGMSEIYNEEAAKWMGEMIELYKEEKINV